MYEFCTEVLFLWRATFTYLNWCLAADRDIWRSIWNLIVGAPRSSLGWIHYSFWLLFVSPTPLALQGSPYSFKVWSRSIQVGYIPSSLCNFFSSALLLWLTIHKQTCNPKMWSWSENLLSKKREKNNPIYICSSTVAMECHCSKWMPYICSICRNKQESSQLYFAQMSWNVHTIWRWYFYYL